MSVVTYNGITLPMAFTTDLEQNVIYDETNTDAAYIQFDVTVQSIVNSDYLQVYTSNLPTGVSNNPADIMKYLRGLLLQPRKLFKILVNGVNLIPDPLGSGTSDALNGPKPQSCRIFPMTDTTFLIQYHIIAHYHECNLQTTGGTASFPVQNQPGNDILYNRWSERVDLDDLQYTKRIRTGKFVIKSDNPDGFIADQLRTQMAVIGVPRGFLRESSSYTVDPSGLILEYEMVDKEVFKLPPKPAFKASGEYFETSILNGGGRPGRTVEARVRLEADKLTSQSSLIELCVAVAVSKVNLGTKSRFIGAAIPQSLGLQVNMYENKVECHARAWATPSSFKPDSTKTLQNFWGTSYRDVAYTPGSDDQGDYLPLYFERGTAGILLQAAAHWDPCLQGMNLQCSTGQFSPISGGQLPGTGGKGNIGPIGPDGSNDNPLTCIQPTSIISSIQVRDLFPTGVVSTVNPNIIFGSIWTDYQIKMYYEKDNHLYMMPISSPNGFPVGQSAAFVQLAAPTLLVIADWTAARFGQQPIIPSPISQNPFFVLMDEHYDLMNLGLDGGAQTALYRISGTYVYGHTSPSTLTVQNMLFPVAPWITPGAFDRTMSPGFLSTGIID